MTYEEKLTIVVNAITEARRFARKGQAVNLRIGTGNGLTRMHIGHLYDILLQLQDDEKIIKIQAIPSSLKTGWEVELEKLDYFVIDILDGYDKWCSDYLIKNRTSIENLTETNLSEIFVVLTQIEEQVQFAQLDKFNFSFVTSTYDLQGYDTEDIDSLTDGYIKVLDYLKKLGVVKDYSHGAMSLDADIELDMQKFYELLDRIKGIKFKKGENLDKQISIEKDNKQQNIPNGQRVIWSDDFEWDGKSFIFGNYGEIKFSSEDRRHIFKTLTDKKGGWATIKEMGGNKDANYVRSTIKQIEDKLSDELKKHIKIVSTQEDDLKPKPSQGAYRIKAKL